MDVFLLCCRYLYSLHYIVFLVQVLICVAQIFLWAKDLSAFDDVIKFGTNIPLLGSHLSLFTITAVFTSLLISIYSMNMSPDQSNPVMKYMPYIFPVFLLFIFNRLPSALTWYYTVSNIITLILQFVIQNYIIDHDKIVAQDRREPEEAKGKIKMGGKDGADAGAAKKDEGNAAERKEISCFS